MDRFNAWVGALVARIANANDEDGQTFVEYALVLSVIVVATLLAVTWSGLADGLKDSIADVKDALTTP